MPVLYYGDIVVLRCADPVDVNPTLSGRYAVFKPETPVTWLPSSRRAEATRFLVMDGNSEGRGSLTAYPIGKKTGASYNNVRFLSMGENTFFLRSSNNNDRTCGGKKYPSFWLASRGNEEFALRDASGQNDTDEPARDAQAVYITAANGNDTPPTVRQCSGSEALVYSSSDAAGPPVRFYLEIALRGPMSQRRNLGIVWIILITTVVIYLAYLICITVFRLFKGKKGKRAAFIRRAEVARELEKKERTEHAVDSLLQAVDIVDSTDSG